MSLLFVAAFGVTGMATWLVLKSPLEESAQARLVREAGLVTTIYATHDPADALKRVDEREHRLNGLSYRVTDRQGRRIADRPAKGGAG